MILTGETMGRLGQQAKRKPEPGTGIKLSSDWQSAGFKTTPLTRASQRNKRSAQET
jgi:hypothetical protein